MKGHRTFELAALVAWIAVINFSDAIARERRLRLHQEGITRGRHRNRGKESQTAAPPDPDESNALGDFVLAHELEGTMYSLPTSFPTPLPVAPSRKPSRPSRVPSRPSRPNPSPTNMPSAIPFPTRSPITPTNGPTARSEAPITVQPTVFPTRPFPPITLIPIVEPTASPTSSPATEQTLLEVISKIDAFDTFDIAVQTAGLSDLLASNDATLTVFAPANRAFDDIEPAYQASLLSPPYNLQLVSLVSYHILSGIDLSTPELTNGLILTMLNQLSISTSRNAPGVVPEIQLVTPSVEEEKTTIISLTQNVDVKASNGVAHEVDSVIFPSWYFYDGIEVIRVQQGTYTVLGAVLEAIGFNSSLTSATIFGPNDSAFARLPEESRDFLQAPGNSDIMRQIIEYNVIEELVPFTELPVGASEFQTQLGEFVTINKSDSSGPILAAVNVNGIAIRNFSLGRSTILYELGGILIPPSLVPSIPGIPSKTRA